MSKSERKKVTDAKYAANWRARNPTIFHSRIRETKIKKRNLITSLKQKPCLDCGGSFPPICMDFDHVRGKKLFNLAAAPNLGVSVERLHAEILKCDLVCANCHRIRTESRRLVIAGDKAA